MPARSRHSASLRASTARQLQALVRRRAHRGSQDAPRNPAGVQIGKLLTGSAIGGANVGKCTRGARPSVSVALSHAAQRRQMPTALGSVHGGVASQLRARIHLQNAVKKATLPAMEIHRGSAPPELHRSSERAIKAARMAKQISQSPTATRRVTETYWREGLPKRCRRLTDRA